MLNTFVRTPRFLAGAALALGLVLASLAGSPAHAAGPETVSVPVAGVVGEVAYAYYSPPAGKKITGFALKNPGICSVLEMKQLGDSIRIAAFAPPGSVIGRNWSGWIQLDIVLDK